MANHEVLRLGTSAAAADAGQTPMQELARATDERTTAAAALKLVQKIIENLVANPADLKFTKINLDGNAGKKLAAEPRSLDFLKSVGFAESEDETGNFVIPLEKSCDGDAPSSAVLEAQAAVQQAIQQRPASEAPRAEKRPAPVGSATQSRPPPAMSAKQKARLMKEEKERQQREHARLLRQKELEKIKQDNFVRKNDPNWKSGLSAAAGKGGDVISTFRQQFGED